MRAAGGAPDAGTEEISMLELQHISYDVEQDGEDKGILHDINLKIGERFVAITGPNGGASPPWPR